MTETRPYTGVSTDGVISNDFIFVYQQHMKSVSLSAVHVTLLTPGVVAYFLIYKCVINVSIFFQLIQYT